jgi:hypothetical protein
LVFGVPAPQDGKGGGWKGLAVWLWRDDPNFSEVQIDIARVTAIGAENWLPDFVRAIIERCGWTIAEELQI